MLVICGLAFSLISLSRPVALRAEARTPLINEPEEELP